MRKSYILYRIGRVSVFDKWRSGRYARSKFYGLVRGAIACVRVPVDGSRFRVGKHCFVGVTPGASLKLGHSVIMYDNTRINVEGNGAALSIGDKSVLNSGAEIFCRESVTIGVKSGLGFNSFVTDTDFHPIQGQEMTAPVVIEDHVWVGANVTILKGVTIGKGAMIAAGSLVTTDIPAGMLAVGRPAKPIRPITWEF